MAEMFCEPHGRALTHCPVCSPKKPRRMSRLYEQVQALRMDVNEPWDPTAIAYRHGRNDVVKDVLHLLDEHRLSSEKKS
jgi:hypothetical protein